MFEGVLRKDKRTTPWWKVIPFMVVIAAVIGVRTCRVLEADQAEQQYRERQLRHGQP